MKILVLKPDSKVRPLKQPFTYPRHNNDYGVEQNFYDFLMANQYLLTDSIDEADWHYLPVYWTRWHLNHNYGTSGLDELEKMVLDSIIDESKTFTICQYDDGPLINIGQSLQFLASRNSNFGVDIPLLSKKHSRSFFKRSKLYSASFIGRVSTHEVRQQMFACLKNRSDLYLFDGDLGTRSFASVISRSYLALAPRGYGGSSFRMYEAMQLGVAPILIGNIDTRPFQDYLPWEDVSFYCKSVEGVAEIIDQVPKETLIEMGLKAKSFYDKYLAYNKWCMYVLKVLEEKLA